MSPIPARAAAIRAGKSNLQMSLRTALTSAHEAVASVQAVAKSLGWEEWGHWKINQLAYNPFKASESPWWLSPTAENPAYKYVKIKFVPRSLDGSHGVCTQYLFVGLNVEKGVTGPAAVAFADLPRKYRHYVMRQDWAWHRFIGALETASLKTDIQDLAKQGEPAALTIAVTAADIVIQDDDSSQDRHDFEIPRGGRHEVQYQASSGPKLVLTHDHPIPGGSKLFKPPDILDGIGQLQALLSTLDSTDWKWVDVLIGFHFDRASEGDDSAAWDARKIWDKICMPLSDVIWGSPDRAGASWNS